jgi:hypothetical protein
MGASAKLLRILKGLYSRREWTWDHLVSADEIEYEIGADGRWEISLYSPDDLSEEGYAGYAALVPLEDGRWMVIFRLEDESVYAEEDEDQRTRPTLSEAKRTLDLMLGANTPEIPADRDSADPLRKRENQWLIQYLLDHPDKAEWIEAKIRELLKKQPPDCPQAGGKPNH